MRVAEVLLRGVCLSGVASVAAYIYALDAVVKYIESSNRTILGRELSPGEYAFWMSVQWLCTFFTVGKGVREDSLNVDCFLHFCREASTGKISLLRLPCCLLVQFIYVLPNLHEA